MLPLEEDIPRTTIFSIQTSITATGQLGSSSIPSRLQALRHLPLRNRRDPSLLQLQVVVRRFLKGCGSNTPRRSCNPTSNGGGTRVISSLPRGPLPLDRSLLHHHRRKNYLRMPKLRIRAKAVRWKAGAYRVAQGRRLRGNETCGIWYSKSTMMIVTRNAFVEILTNPN